MRRMVLATMLPALLAVLGGALAVADPSCPLPDLKDTEIGEFLGGTTTTNRSVYVSIFNNDNIANPYVLLLVRIISQLPQSPSPSPSHSQLV